MHRSHIGGFCCGAAPNCGKAPIGLKLSAEAPEDTGYQCWPVLLALLCSTTYEWAMLMLACTRPVATLVLGQLLGNTSGVGNPASGLLGWKLPPISADGGLTELALVIASPPHTVPSDEIDHSSIRPRCCSIGMLMDEVPSIVALRIVQLYAEVQMR